MVNKSFLLDTHVFIWAMEESSRLPEHIKREIINPQNNISISVATLWEIVIKITTKQVKFKFDLEDSIKKVGLEVVPIQTAHVVQLFKIPLYHKDPFDRILIAQAKAENLTLITSDEKIWKYDVSCLKV